MSHNRRIILNVIATYGRSLYALLIGLFVARWVLQALGKTDYGLMGVVGGLSGFVAFLNSLMATAVGRFYAVNIGRAKRTDSTKEDLIVCQCWFNTAVSIHCVLPLVLIMVGYVANLWQIGVNCPTQSCNYSGSYYGQSNRMYHFKVPTRCFDKTIRVAFENTTLPLCVGFDEVVRAEYPDYLTLPPPEKQVLLHSDQIDAPWLAQKGHI